MWRRFDSICLNCGWVGQAWVVCISFCAFLQPAGAALYCCCLSLAHIVCICCCCCCCLLFVAAVAAAIALLIIPVQVQAHYRPAERAGGVVDWMVQFNEVVNLL